MARFSRLADDVFGWGCPDEPFRIFVPFANIGCDGSNQFRQAAERALPNAAFRNLGKETLDQI
jgi:hypothetical protein